PLPGVPRPAEVDPVNATHRPIPARSTPARPNQPSKREQPLPIRTPNQNIFSTLTACHTSPRPNRPTRDSDPPRPGRSTSRAALRIEPLPELAGAPRVGGDCIEPQRRSGTHCCPGSGTRAARLRFEVEVALDGVVPPQIHVRQAVIARRLAPVVLGLGDERGGAGDRGEDALV